MVVTSIEVKQTLRIIIFRKNSAIVQSDPPETSQVEGVVVYLGTLIQSKRTTCTGYGPTWHFCV